MNRVIICVPQTVIDRLGDAYTTLGNFCYEVCEELAQTLKISRADIEVIWTTYHGGSSKIFVDVQVSVGESSRIDEIHAELWNRLLSPRIQAHQMLQAERVNLRVAAIIEHAEATFVFD